MFAAFSIQVRYIQAIMLWIGVLLCYVLRVNMSVAVVAMTSNKVNVDSSYQTYNWTEVEKSRILSSFFWGYIALHILFGNVAEKIGTKMILTSCLTLASLFTVAIPLAIDGGYLVVLVLRMLEGLVQGAIYPCVTVHISKWVPPSERLWLLSFCYSGSAFGPLIGFPLCGYLGSSSGGWPSIFYVTGGLGFVWVLLWSWIGANSPKEHATISSTERSYIQNAIQHDVKPIQNLKTPWKEILLSIPVHAVLIGSIVIMWGYWTLLAEMPNYLSGVLNLNLKENGLLASLPYASAYVATIIYSCAATHITNNCKISKTLHRNIWNSIAAWGSASTLLILSFMDRPSTFTAVGLLILTVTLMAAFYNGYATNSIDLSPNFCGTVTGISSTAGTLGPIFGPLCVGWLVKDPSSQKEWSAVFQLTSTIMIVGNIVFVIFSSSEVQSWNDPTIEKKLVCDNSNQNQENQLTSTRM